MNWLWNQLNWGKKCLWNKQILYGLIIISGIDNVIRPKIIGDKAKVHPVLVLVGVLGGLYLIGFMGIVVGPLILVLFVTFVKAYESDKSIRKP